MDSLAKLRASFEALTEPVSAKSFKEIGLIKEITLNSEKRLTVKLSIGFPGKGVIDTVKSLIEDRAKEEGFGSVAFDIKSEIVRHRVKLGVKPIASVKNILAVSSAKGGVGKSTVAVNVAFALKRLGARVGILDADIYGPSVPILLGIKGKPTAIDEKSMSPVEVSGIAVNSIGFFVSENEPLAWRGPVASRAIRELAEKTKWPDLDYLIIDMPPGTGDIQLTLAQSVPLTAALVVTTPQRLACADAARGLSLFEKLGIPIVGLVENMAYFKCSKCQSEERLFGKGHTQELVQKFGVSLLGSLPITPQMAEGFEVTERPSDTAEINRIFDAIALRAAIYLSRMPKDWIGIKPEAKSSNEH